MNLVLRVELTKSEREELDKYLLVGNYPFGQISHILRCAVRNFIKEGKEKELIKESTNKELNHEKSKRQRSTSKRNS
jgi:hypothetical protein